MSLFNRKYGVADLDAVKEIIGDVTVTAKELDSMWNPDSNVTTYDFKIQDGRRVSFDILALVSIEDENEDNHMCGVFCTTQKIYRIQKNEIVAFYLDTNDFDETEEIYENSEFILPVVSDESAINLVIDAYNELIDKGPGELPWIFQQLRK